MMMPNVRSSQSCIWQQLAKYSAAARFSPFATHLEGVDCFLCFALDPTALLTAHSDLNRTDM